MNTLRITLEIMPSYRGTTRRPILRALKRLGLMTLVSGWLMSCSVTPTFPRNFFMPSDVNVTLLGQSVTEEVNVQIVEGSIIISGVKNLAPTITDRRGIIEIEDLDTEPLYEAVPSILELSAAVLNPSGVASAELALGTVTIVPLHPIIKPVDYTIKVRFVDSFQLALTGDIEGEMKMLSEGTEKESVRLKRCGVYDPELTVFAGGVLLPYTVRREPPAMSPYYDPAASAANTRTEVLQVNNEAGVVAARFELDVEVQECTLTKDNLRGEGTILRPWQIDTALRLDLVSRLVNADHTRYGRADSYYEVTRDIDLGHSEASWSESMGGAGFTPIGTTHRALDAVAANHLNRFSGKFDCNGYVIRRLYISNERNHVMNTGHYEGLFGVTRHAEIRNCRLEEVKVLGLEHVGGVIGMMEGGRLESSYVTGTVVGTVHTGGLVGLSSLGTVMNAYATGSVEGESRVGGLVGTSDDDTIMNVYTTSTVLGSGGSVGGLVGSNMGGHIINAYALGAVSGAGDHVGGLAGFNGGTITNAYAAGEVVGTSTHVGGITGFNSGVIKSSYATGAVRGTYFNVGGLAGTNTGTLSNVYATGRVVGGDSNIGGLVGGNIGMIADSYALGAVVGEHTEGVGGFSGSNGAIGITGSIMRSYSAGAVEGRTAAVGGGFIAYNGIMNGVVDCYWDSEASGKRASAEGTGKTTAELQTLTPYANWDTGVWEFRAGSYPRLRNVVTRITVYASWDWNVWERGTEGQPSFKTLR